MSMGSDKVFAAIEAIAATSSKNEKQALVAVGLEDNLFRFVVFQALNPLITFGVAKRPDTRPENGVGQFDVATVGLLKRLAKRELTGSAAIETIALTMESMTKASAELLWRIIAKDLRAGFSESTVNKAKKGTIPEFAYMRCSLPKDAKLDKFSWVDGVYSQLKADGMFANIDHQGEEVRITSRQGTPYPLDEFGPLVADVRANITDNTQSHGELLVYQGGEALPRELSNGIMNSLATGGKLEAGQVVHFLAWDSIPLSAAVPKGKHTEPYKERYARLKADTDKGGTAFHLIETRIVHSMLEAREHFRCILKKGLEGTVFKDGNAIWKDGTSKEQIKLKLTVEVDLEVIAIVPGKAGKKNEHSAGSLTCVTSDRLLQTDVTVKNDKMRADVDANPDKWIGSIIPVSFNSIMEPSESNTLNSLFLPRMTEASYRTDKTEADSLQRVRDQYQAAIDEA